ncbi:MAG: FAD-dependent oxidoreductase [Thermoprotei archaeon]
MNYDAIIIGGGGGGYPGAFRLSDSGLSVALIDDKGELGGNCLYSGCIPSKTVREIAQTVMRVRRILGAEVKADFAKIQDHKDWVQETRFSQHREELKEHPNVTFIKGKARLLSPHEVEVNGETLRADYVVIATGSEAIRPKFPGSEHAITSDELYGYKTNLRRIEGKVVIIGGGYIALETASVLQALGYDVELLVRGDSVMRNLSQEIADVLLPLLNLKINFNSPVLEIKKVKEGEYQVVYSRKDGSKGVLDAGLVVLATGRRPVVPEGTDAVGLKRTVKGGIEVDEAMRTNLPQRLRGERRD